MDRLGIDVNEAGWAIGFAMECYEKGALIANDVGGVPVTWGNAEAATELLNRIACRNGVGGLLAEVVMRSLVC